MINIFKKNKGKKIKVFSDEDSNNNEKITKAETRNESKPVNKPTIQNEKMKNHSEPISTSVSIPFTKTEQQVDKKISSEKGVETNPVFEAKEYSVIEKDLVEPKKKIFKPLINKKLNILLVENNVDISLKKKLFTFIKKQLRSDEFIIIISYGDSVTVSEIMQVSEVDNDNLTSCSEITNLCLCDALVKLEECFSENYLNVFEKNENRIKITNIDIIGIGSCVDIGSEASKEYAYDLFDEIIRNKNITTKYFCYTDENFSNAAEVGFRSIGAIFKNYQ